MKRRYFAKWLIVILLMAIGIGIVGALTISEKQKEENDARPTSYITNQRKKDIDMTELGKLLGDYQTDGWQLSIYEEKDEKGPYLTLRDGSGAGFEGRIMFLKKGIIIVEIDEDLYEGMPDGWEPEGKGKYAILDISKTDGGVKLGYRGADMDFSA